MPETQPGLIRLAGDLDLRDDAFAELLARFADSTRADAAVELSQVTRFDPAALSFLVALRRICASRNGAVTLVNPSSVVRRALSHGLEPYFQVRVGADQSTVSPPAD